MTTYAIKVQNTMRSTNPRYNTEGPMTLYHYIGKNGWMSGQSLYEGYSHEKMAERGVVQIPLCFLAKSLENMSLCHVAYFCTGWENARGCRIEHDAAVAYGLEVIEE